VRASHPHAGVACSAPALAQHLAAGTTRGQGWATRRRCAMSNAAEGSTEKILYLLRHGETEMNVFLRDHPDKGDGML